MAVTSYYSVNGILLGEKPSGSGRVDYLSDALGSVYLDKESELEKP